MLGILIVLIISSVVLLSLSLFPLILKRFQEWHKKREKKAAVELDKLFHTKSPKEIVRTCLILASIFGFLGFFVFKSFLFVIAGAVLGLSIPNFILKMDQMQRRNKFNNQLLDAIMILSSSLKGGLSLLQAFEVLVEEMPAPMSEEFSLLIKENKMGVVLEESLKHLDSRMKIEELGLVINAILVAREAGGDLTKVFARVTATIRDNRKLKDSIKTLTLQGRMQGIIMSGLPFLFIWWTMTFNRHHFDIMFESELGKTLLFAAIFLQVAGMFLIKKFSTVKL